MKSPSCLYYVPKYTPVSSKARLETCTSMPIGHGTMVVIVYRCLVEAHGLSASTQCLFPSITLTHLELQSSNRESPLPIIPFDIARTRLRFCRTTFTEPSIYKTTNILSFSSYRERPTFFRVVPDSKRSSLSRQTVAFFLILILELSYRLKLCFLLAFVKFSYLHASR